MPTASSSASSRTSTYALLNPTQDNHSFIASPPKHDIWRTVFLELWKVQRFREPEVGNPVISAALQNADPEIYTLLPANLYGGQRSDATSAPASCAAKAVHQPGSRTWKIPIEAEEPPPPVLLYVLILLFSTCSVVAYRVATQRWQWLPTADETERIHAAAEFTAEEQIGEIGAIHASSAEEQDGAGMTSASPLRGGDDEEESIASTAIDMELLPNPPKDHLTHGVDMGTRRSLDMALTRPRSRSC